MAHGHAKYPDLVGTAHSTNVYFYCNPVHLVQVDWTSKPELIVGIHLLEVEVKVAKQRWVAIILRGLDAEKTVHDLRLLLCNLGVLQVFVEEQDEHVHDICAHPALVALLSRLQAAALQERQLELLRLEFVHYPG